MNCIFSGGGALFTAALNIKFNLYIAVIYTSSPTVAELFV